MREKEKEKKKKKTGTPRRHRRHLLSNNTYSPFRIH